MFSGFKMCITLSCHLFFYFLFGSSVSCRVAGGSPNRVEPIRVKVLAADKKTVEMSMGNVVFNYKVSTKRYKEPHDKKTYLFLSISVYCCFNFNQFCIVIDVVQVRKINNVKKKNHHLFLKVVLHPWTLFEKTLCIF